MGSPRRLKRATAYSVNTVFAQLVRDVGVMDAAELAHRLGVTTVPSDGMRANGELYGPSLALGAAEVPPLAMAAAYGVFANRGVRVPALPVVRVTAVDGEVLEDNAARRGRRVLAVAVADRVTEALRDVVEYGTGTTAEIPVPAAGKTGTAENHSDAWFAGFTPNLSTAVWMGYADSQRPLTPHQRAGKGLRRDDPGPHLGSIHDDQLLRDRFAGPGRGLAPGGVAPPGRHPPALDHAELLPGHVGESQAFDRI